MKNKILRVIILFFSLIALCHIVPLEVNAEDKNEVNLYIETEEEARKLIEETVGKLTRDYHGWCGLYVRHNVVSTGILKPSTRGYDGHDWYKGFRDNYSGNKLADGWTYECFAGEEGLKELLEKYNGRVYNLIFSMPSGNVRFGHVCFVNAIINDKVYYTESYDSAYLGAKQKHLIVIDLEDFVDYYFYDDYYKMDKGGIIHFYEEGFYKEVVTFNENDTVSQSYVYQYANQQSSMTDENYNELINLEYEGLLKRLMEENALFKYLK